MGLNGTKAKLLVVDDEPDQLATMVSLLRSEGYEVLEAVNGTEALDQAREKHPDLIIIDMTLPDKSGLEVSKEIKLDKELQKTLIILVSEGEISPKNRSKWLEEGIDGCLTRPVSSRELLALVESMIRLKESESKYKSIFENTGTATIIIDENKTITLANSEFEQLSGYTKLELEGKKNWTEFVSEEDLDKLVQYHDLKMNDPVSAPSNYKIKFKDRNNNLKEIFITVGMISFTRNSVVSLLDISQREKTEKALSKELKINSDLAKLSSKLLESTPIEDISDLVLEYAQNFTQSEFGFVGFIDPETGYLISPTMTRNIWTKCHVKDKSIIFEKFGGLWGWVLNNKESILTNQPNEDPRSTGTPTGHVAIETFLAVPAMVNENLVGIISLANSEEYNKHDLEVVKRLSDLYAIAITRKHSDEALRKNEEKYRSIVGKFLKLHNEILMEISNR